MIDGCYATIDFCCFITQILRRARRGGCSRITEKEPDKTMHRNRYPQSGDPPQNVCDGEGRL